MKPTVFNYQEYERVVEENKKLNAEAADLRIRCRIAESDQVASKSDLISRADAIDTVEELNRKVNDGRETDTICTSDVLRRINTLPSADAVATFRTGQTYGKSTSIRELVEVVRCKDCKHRRENCGMGDHRWCDVLKMTTREDDFCSYGKRREP